MALAAGGIEDEIERYLKDLRNFMRVRYKNGRRCDQGDDRGYLESGAGDVGIESADWRHKAAGKTDFFLGLAQGRLDWVAIPRLAPSAGEADLTSVRLQMIGAARQQDRKPLRPIDQRHEDGGLGQRTIGQQIRIEIMIATADAGWRSGGEAGHDMVTGHAGGSHCPSGKNRSLLHTPYSSLSPQRRTSASSTSS